MSDLGDCFEVSLNEIAFPMGEFAGNDTARLVHGTVIGQGEIEGIPYAHAWIEFDMFVPGPGGRQYPVRFAVDRAVGRDIRMPAELYRRMGQVSNAVEYTEREARRKAMQSGHYGPWHDDPKWKGNPLSDLDDYAGWPRDAIEDALIDMVWARGAILRGDYEEASSRLLNAVRLLDWSNGILARWERQEFEVEPPEAPPPGPGDPPWAPPPRISKKPLAVLDTALSAARANNLKQANELISVAAAMLQPIAVDVSPNAASKANMLASEEDPRKLLDRASDFKFDLGINPRLNPSDERALELERAAAEGDIEAYYELVNYWTRAGEDGEVLRVMDLAQNLVDFDRKDADGHADYMNDPWHKALKWSAGRYWVARHKSEDPFNLRERGPRQ